MASEICWLNLTMTRNIVVLEYYFLTLMLRIIIGIQLCELPMFPNNTIENFVNISVSWESAAMLSQFIVSEAKQIESNYEALVMTMLHKSL